MPPFSATAHRGLILVSALCALTLLSAGAASASTSARGSATTSGPAIITLTASPASIASYQGRAVGLRVRVQSASYCTFSEQRTPFSSFYPVATARCDSGSAHMTVPAVRNLHYVTLPISYKVEAFGPGGTSVAIVKVREHGMPRPPVVTPPVVPPVIVPPVVTPPVVPDTVASAPLNLTLPVVDGAPADNMVLSGDPGTWSGSPAPSFAYQWLQCTSGIGPTERRDNGCEAIEGATGQSYTPTTDDEGWTLALRVTATNDSGSATAVSAESGYVTGAPINIDPPVIYGGDAVVGQTLYGGFGNWRGFPDSTWIYAFVGCPDNGAFDLFENDDSGCVGLTENEPSYTLTDNEIGDAIYFVVIATNGSGSAGAVSDPFDPVVAGETAPANVVLPSFSDDGSGGGNPANPQAGDVLTGDDGTWTGNPTSYDEAFWGCRDGALFGLGSYSCTLLTSGNTYTLTADELGDAIYFVARASNDLGSVFANSDTSAVVGAGPVLLSAPTLNNDDAAVGSGMGGSPGTWSGDPTPDLTADIISCPLPNLTVDDVLADAYGCQTLSSDDAASIPSSMVGSYLYLLASATNSSGTTWALSVGGLLVTDSAVPADASISFSGGGSAVADGQSVLTVTVTLTNASGFPLAGEWITLTTSSSGGPFGGVVDPSATTISPASGLTDSNGQALFQVSSTQAGTWVGFINAGPINDPDFNDVGSFTAVPVTNLTPPTISGNTVVGQTLTIDPGTWSPAQSSYNYVWLRCDTSGTVNAMHCGSLDPQGDTYQVVSADVGHRIGAYVATANWSDMATTAATAVVIAAVAPQNTAPPTLSGSTEVGQTLTVNPGTWTGTPAPTFTVAWQSCDNPISGDCTPIAGAGNGLTYTTQTSDIYRTIKVSVTATNSAGNASASPMSFGGLTIHAVPPVVLTQPVISGDAVVGQTLTVSDGTWSPAQSGLLYYWFTCDDTRGLAGHCTSPGYTSNSYQIVSGDIGHTFVVRVATSDAQTFGETAITAVVTAAVAPANTVAASLTDNGAGGGSFAAPKVGDVLTGHLGTWTGNPTPGLDTYLEACPGGSNCAFVTPDSGLNYTLTSADIGSEFGFSVQGHNGVGSGVWSSSGFSGFVTAASPVTPSAGATYLSYLANPVAADGSTPLTVLVHLRAAGGDGGIPVVGATVTLTTKTDSFLGSAGDQITDASKVSIAPASAGSDVTGADGIASFTVRSTVAGTWYGVIGVPAASFSDLYSAVPGYFQPVAPANTVKPVVTVGGSAFTATPGTWSGSPAPTYSYAWHVCTGINGTSCTIVDGQTSSSLDESLAPAIGSVYVTVTASNGVGSPVVAVSDPANYA